MRKMGLNGSAMLFACAAREVLTAADSEVEDTSMARRPTEKARLDHGDLPFLSPDLGTNKTDCSTAYNQYHPGAGQMSAERVNPIEGDIPGLLQLPGVRQRAGELGEF